MMTKEQELHHGSGRWKALAALHLPRMAAGEQHQVGSGKMQDAVAAGSSMPPKGYVAVRVGAEGEEQRRFVVPLVHLHHPLFAALLEEAEEVYGFEHKGAIAIPCRVERFQQVEGMIDREIGGCGAAHQHHHQQHHQHEKHHGHHYLPHFAGCFKA